MSKEKSTNNNVKKRNWAFVLYPESAPEDWQERLQLTGLECVISPLHDKDTNPTGEPKKAHYHIILCYSGPTSYNVVNNLCQSLNCPIPQPLESVKGYYRYLSHKDNPEKYQYDEKEIKALNGFNILNYIELTKAEAAELKREIMGIIRDKGFFEYSDLLDYLLDNGMFEALDVAANNTILFNTYISSRRYKTADEKDNKRKNEIKNMFDGF